MPCSDHRDTVTESGGTEMGVGAVSNGQYLRRVGDELVGATVTAPPIGGVMMWAGFSGSVPSSWFLCDGSQYDPGTIPSLAAVITTKFNTGGETPGWIRVPDMRSRFPQGAATDPDVGTLGGASSHSHTNAAMSTGITATVANNAQRQVAAVGNNTVAAQPVAVIDPGHTHLMNSVSSLPPYLAMHWIIRAT